ncbi:MAG: riboflavin biosynthesis protein RibF [Bacteroidales bacterium]|nr:riboflavin biosynthesis protein RibF [Bacteroidales bacterium]
MAVAATGFFDGVHLGHRAVIETLLKTARERSEQSLILTFWPHPRTVLRGGSRDLRLLTSLDEKISILKSLGVDRVEVLPFTRDFAALTARQYLEMLRRDYGVTSIVLGYDNRFGSDNLSTEELSSLINSTIVSCTDDISSTKVRKKLGLGEVKEAAQMLGYEYSLSGVVVSGNMMGRTIGFPTANMKLREPLKCLPKVGAYLTRVEVEGRQLWGMTNIDHNEKIETNIFDFDEEIYGLDLKVTFVDKLRDEIHFNSFDELKTQLEKDRITAIGRIV